MRGALEEENLLYKAQFVCLSVRLYKSTVFHRFGLKLVWSIIGDSGRGRSGCWWIQSNHAAPSNLQKPEVPISQQLLNRFQPKLVCGCMYHVQVSFQKIATIEACSAELSCKNGSAHISETAILILTKLAVWMATLCGSIILKYQDDQGAQRRVMAFLWEVVGLGAKRLALRHAAPSQSAKHLGWKSAGSRRTTLNLAACG